MADAAIYSSARAASSLWQRHRVYADRVELGTVFGPMVVPLERIEGVRVMGPLAGGTGGAIFSWRVVKLDKSGGWLRTVHFCPPDPDGFAAAVEEALAARERAGGVGSDA